MNNVERVLKDTWFQLWLMVATVGAFALAISLGDGANTASASTQAPAVLPLAAPIAAPQVAVGIELSKPALPTTMPFLAGTSKKSGVWIVDLKDSPDRDTDSVVDAVTKANDGDLILIRPGVYKGPMTLEKSLTLRGQPGPSEPVVLENDGETVVTQEHGESRLERLEVVQKGDKLDCVVVHGGKLFIQDARLQSEGRSAVLIQKGAADIRSSTMTSAGSGVLANASLRCRNCTFLRCGADGVAVVNKGSADIFSSTFRENKLGLVTQGSVLVEDSVFSDNDGAISFQGKGAALQRVRIEGNREIGLHLFKKAEALVQDSDILRNGEGIRIGGDARLTIRKSRVHGNTIGIYGYGKARVIANDNDFTGNRVLFKEKAKGEGKGNKTDPK